jgi:hypothetical protein
MVRNKGYTLLVVYFGVCDDRVGPRKCGKIGPLNGSLHVEPSDEIGETLVFIYAALAGGGAGHVLRNILTEKPRSMDVFKYLLLSRSIQLPEIFATYASLFHCSYQLSSSSALFRE